MYEPSVARAACLMCLVSWVWPGGRLVCETTLCCTAAAAHDAATATSARCSSRVWCHLLKACTHVHKHSPSQPPLQAGPWMLLTSACRFRFSRFGLAITFCQARLQLLLRSVHAACLPACLQCSLRDREGAEAMSSPPALPTPLLPAAGVCCGHRSFLPQCLLPAAHVHVRSGGAWCAIACVGWSTGPIVAASHVEPHTHPSAPPPAACTGFCTSALALPWHASLGCWCCRARQVGQPLASGWRLQHVPSC